MTWQDYKIEDNYQRIFIPQRTQPPHIGHIGMLEAACEEASEVIIGIGSANKHDEMNPYFAIEREMMLRYSLEEKGITNYRFVHIPDFEDDNEWMEYVVKEAHLDKNTKIVSGNGWVGKIFGGQGCGGELLLNRADDRGGLAACSAAHLVANTGCDNVIPG